MGNEMLSSLGVCRGVKESSPGLTGGVTINVRLPRGVPHVGWLMSDETESRHSVAIYAD
jgi:hypothetical protein